MGVFRWKEGHRYYGNFKDGDMQGLGHYFGADKTYHGNFDLDKKHGHGHLYFSDGRKYMGTFYRGKQHGLGFYIDKSGKEKYGLWENGKHVMYFEQDEIIAINKNEVDMARFFTDQNSYHEVGARFGPPDGFSDKLKMIAV